MDNNHNITEDKNLEAQMRIFTTAYLLVKDIISNKTLLDWNEIVVITKDI